MKQLTIVEEFKKLIPALTEKEYSMLEQSILTEGIRDPIIVWGDIIVDGHNRYKLAQKYKIEFKAVGREFTDIDEVKIWIIENQLSRRNLSKEQLAIIAIDYKNLLSIEAEKRMKHSIDKPAAKTPQAKLHRFSDGRFCKISETPEEAVLYDQEICKIENGLGYNDPVVYFIQAEGGGDIKIGVSKNVNERLKQLQISNSEKLIITNILPGGYEKEKELHEKFKGINKGGEWFKATHMLAEISKALPFRILTSSEQASKTLGVCDNYVKKAVKIEKERPELLSKIKDGELSLLTVYNDIKKVEKEEELKNAIAKSNSESEHGSIIPTLYKESYETFDRECDLLITDPPYMTDIDNINEFAKWLPKKLECVKSTGSAFIFVGAYPEELNAYMNVSMPTQVLVWTYRNTLGRSPLNKYKLNWQAILYYRMDDTPELNCPLTNELWTVQDVNAPDGRLGNRYHCWQKPIELAERLIRHATKKGDVVFDCFSGTGTFLLAAAKLGRIGIGCEINPEMIDIAVKRGVDFVQ